MKVRILHSWNMNPAEARDLQTQLAPLVSGTSAIAEDVRYVAGTDISGPNPDGTVRAAVVVLSYPDLEVAEVSVVEGRPNFPYVPGLLSFRETPVLIEALEKLVLDPDILIIDGHGLAHPRRFGIACHIGVLADVPTIGCAKSRLTGEHGPLGSDASSQVELIDRGAPIGMVVRTRRNVSPIYVSVGHKVDLASAVGWVTACCRSTRLPETTRLAHRAAGGQVAPGLRQSRAVEATIATRP